MKRSRFKHSIPGFIPLTLCLLLLALGPLSACNDDKTDTATDQTDDQDDSVHDVAADSGDDSTDIDADTSSPSLVTYTEEREECADRNPERNAYFGDLHIHTRWSFDAWVEGTRPGPADSYRFAKGDSLPLPPLDENGMGTQTIQLDRPLDFAGVTDHAEYLGEVLQCTDPKMPGYDTARCVSYREMNAQSIGDFGTQLTNEDPMRLELCDMVDCDAANRDVWQRIQDDAEAHYDRSSSCEFTTFVAYEWSANTAGRNLHRNVIFRNDNVPSQPASYIDHPSPEALWDALDRDCLSPEMDCDVLAIPHNSNLSNGGMFMPLYPGATTRAERRELAEQRARLEPLVEIFQHKGGSECANGLGNIMGEPDELCGVEAIRTPPFDECPEGEPGVLGIRGNGCVSKWDYVRSTLIGGLEEEEKLGINPYKLGVIGSTDTHNAIAGAANETNYLGHIGNAEAEPDGRLDDNHLSTWGIVANPGGLAGVWAVENSRDALFEAMIRKETFGTSGTRITPRFFGGWEYQEDVCGAPDLVTVGYENGVPMGGDLPARPTDASPAFIVAANRDPAGSAAPLQVAQVIKGWLESDGTWSYRIYDVAGDADNGASVETDTCERTGTGAATLCGVWTDPDFDAARPAFYYARIVENPSCRWSTYQCNALAEAERPPGCTDPSIPRTIQEMAWTSAIWYSPE